MLKRKITRTKLQFKLINMGKKWNVNKVIEFIYDREKTRMKGV